MTTFNISFSFHHCLYLFPNNFTKKLFFFVVKKCLKLVVEWGGGGSYI